MKQYTIICNLLLCILHCIIYNSNKPFNLMFTTALLQITNIRIKAIMTDAKREYPQNFILRLNVVIFIVIGDDENNKQQTSIFISIDKSVNGVLSNIINVNQSTLCVLSMFSTS